MLKKSLFLLIIPAVVACGNTNTETTAATEEIASAETTSMHYYGDTITAEGAVDPQDFLAQMQGRDSLNVKLEAKINETCRKKGCWMTIDLENGKEMRVRFKDYGFFVPLEGVDGKMAVMEGVAFTDTISVDFLKHLAEDAGKSEEEIAAITEPEIGVNFEAHGVIIKE